MLNSKHINYLVDAFNINREIYADALSIDSVDERNQWILDNIILAFKADDDGFDYRKKTKAEIKEYICNEIQPMDDDAFQNVFEKLIHTAIQVKENNHESLMRFLVTAFKYPYLDKEPLYNSWRTVVAHYAMKMKLVEIDDSLEDWQDYEDKAIEFFKNLSDDEAKVIDKQMYTYAFIKRFED